MARINDTPQKIAWGLGLGVFLGLMPGTGPLAALTLALFFRVNKLAALLGSLLTNTWLSIVTIIPAIKIGSIILNLKWTQVYNDWLAFLSSFKWAALFKISIYRIILPVFLGYVTIGLLLSVIVYTATILILIHKKIMPNRFTKKNIKSGFTLVEVMVVSGIIALMATIAIPVTIKARIVANESTAKATLRSIANALEMYMAANSNYPSAETDLLSPSANPPYLNQGYDGQAIRGYQYTYQFDSNGYKVVATPENCGATGTKNFTLEQNTISEANCS